MLKKSDDNFNITILGTSNGDFFSGKMSCNNPPTEEFEGVDFSVIDENEKVIATGTIARDGSFDFEILPDSRRSTLRMSFGM